MPFGGWWTFRKPCKDNGNSIQRRPNICLPIRGGLYAAIPPPKFGGTLYHWGQETVKVVDSVVRSSINALEQKRRGAAARLRSKGDVQNIKYLELPPMTNHVTLSIEVSCIDHASIVGTLGRWCDGDSIGRIMAETGVIIHFPDLYTNRISGLRSANTVTITGPITNVERARRRLRKFIPITVAFPLDTVKAEIPKESRREFAENTIAKVQNKYSHLDIISLHSRFPKFGVKKNSSSVCVVRGSAFREDEVYGACADLYNLLFDTPNEDDSTPSVLYTTSIDIPVWQQNMITGVPNDFLIRYISLKSNALICFPSRIKRSPSATMLYINGSMRNVILARKYIQALLPVKLAFDVDRRELRNPPDLLNCVRVNRNETCDVNILIKRSRYEGERLSDDCPIRHRIEIDSSEYNLANVYYIKRSVFKPEYRRDPVIAPNDYDFLGEEYRRMATLNSRRIMLNFKKNAQAAFLLKQARPLLKSPLPISRLHHPVSPTAKQMSRNVAQNRGKDQIFQNEDKSFFQTREVQVGQVDSTTHPFPRRNVDVDRGSLAKRLLVQKDDDMRRNRRPQFQCPVVSDSKGYTCPPPQMRCLLPRGNVPKSWDRPPPPITARCVPHNILMHKNEKNISIPEFLDLFRKKEFKPDSGSLMLMSRLPQLGARQHHQPPETKTTGQRDPALEKHDAENRAGNTASGISMDYSRDDCCTGSSSKDTENSKVQNIEVVAGVKPLQSNDVRGMSRPVMHRAYLSGQSLAGQPYQNHCGQQHANFTGKNPPVQVQDWKADRSHSQIYNNKEGGRPLQKWRYGDHGRFFRDHNSGNERTRNGGERSQGSQDWKPGENNRCQENLDGSQNWCSDQGQHSRFPQNSNCDQGQCNRPQQNWNSIKDQHNRLPQRWSGDQNQHFRLNQNWGGEQDQRNRPLQCRNINGNSRPSQSWNFDDYGKSFQTWNNDERNRPPHNWNYNDHLRLPQNKAVDDYNRSSQKWNIGDRGGYRLDGDRNGSKQGSIDRQVRPPQEWNGGENSMQLKHPHPPLITPPLVPVRQCGVDPSIIEEGLALAATMLRNSPPQWFQTAGAAAAIKSGEYLSRFPHAANNKFPPLSPRRQQMLDRNTSEGKFSKTWNGQRRNVFDGSKTNLLRGSNSAFNQRDDGRTHAKKNLSLKPSFQSERYLSGPSSANGQRSSYSNDSEFSRDEISVASGSSNRAAPSESASSSTFRNRPPSDQDRLARPGDNSFSGFSRCEQAGSGSFPRPVQEKGRDMEVQLSFKSYGKSGNRAPYHPRNPQWHGNSYQKN